MWWKNLLITLIVTAFPLIYGNETTTALPTSPLPNTTTTSVTTSTNQVPTSATVVVTTTAITPNRENSSKPVSVLPSIRTDFLNTTSYACSCDLTLGCDVNCCCDIDCSEQFLKAFRCIDEVQLNDYHFSEGLERCELNDGLFCVLHDNLGSPDYYLKARSHSEYSKYRWTDSSHLRDDLELQRNLPVRDFYKYGDEIVAFDVRSEKLDTIKIPATLTDSTCCFREPIKFLQSKRVKCLKTVNELCSFNNDFMMKLLSSQLFQRPSQVTETREAADGFSIRIQSCKHSLLNCTQIKTSEDVVGDVTELMGDEVFDEVRLEFVINDTRLLSASATFLTHDDLTCGVDELGPSKVIQTIEIQFRNINELKDKRIRFKPRGYKDEELILLSRLLPVNASVPDGQKVFEYFHKNDTDDYSFRMKFPENRNGKCVLTEDIHDVVRLNENSQTHCKVELVRNETSNETLCQQMQKQVSNYLFNMMNLTFNGTQVGFASNLFVSRYWSPRFDVSGWTSVIMTNVPAVSTEMKEVDSHCLCTNFFRKAKYSFYTRKVRPTKARTYENVIEGFNIDFGPSGDVKFPIEIENQTISVDVLVQIQFFHEYETALKSNANIDLISSLSLLTVTIFQTML